MLEENEYRKERDDLIGMLDSLRLIKDKGQRKFLKKEIRVILNLLLHD